MKRKWMIAGMLIVCLLLVGMASAAPNGYSIAWWVMGSGSGSGAVGSTSLDSTIGQWVVGGGTSGTTQLGSGFWGGVEAASEADQHQVYIPVMRH